MSGILGKKIGMTGVIQDDGCVIPITVVKCDPNIVTQIKTTEKDGYPAVVLGFSERKKPTKNKKFYHAKEFKTEEEHKKGEKITLEILKDIEKVTVTGVSKGKGFQGVIKKYNFSRGPETHGSHHHREPGAIGACAKPARVHKGKKMPGRMGGKTVTRKNVPIAHLDIAQNVVGLKGPIPGSIGSLVIIKTQ